MKTPLRNPALWIVLATLGVSAASFGLVINALKFSLTKLPIYPEDGVKTAMVPAQTRSWMRARDGRGQEIPDRHENPEIEETLGTTNYVSRYYVERTPQTPGRPVMLELHLAYYTGMIDTVPHVPDRCFVGGGLQIGDNLGDRELNLDRTGWRNDTSVPENLGPISCVYIAGTRPFGDRDVRLCRQPDAIRLRTMRFLAGGADLYAGYFFIANGGHTASPDSVRTLAFDLKTTYAYYLKVQVTSSSCRSADEFVRAASSLISELMGDIMRTTPDWVKVQQGLWPEDASKGKQ